MQGEGSLSRGRVSVQGRGLSPRKGVSFQGNLCSGISVQGVSVQGSLSRVGGLCPG